MFFRIGLLLFSSSPPFGMCVAHCKEHDAKITIKNKIATFFMSFFYVNVIFCSIMSLQTIIDC